MQYQKVFLKFLSDIDILLKPCFSAEFLGIFAFLLTLADSHNLLTFYTFQMLICSMQELFYSQ